MDYLYKEESKELMRIALQLHNELGCGFKEKVYQDAFEVLLKENNSIIRDRKKSNRFRNWKKQTDTLFL